MGKISLVLGLFPQKNHSLLPSPITLDNFCVKWKRTWCVTTWCVMTRACVAAHKASIQLKNLLAAPTGRYGERSDLYTPPVLWCVGDGRLKGPFTIGI